MINELNDLGIHLQITGIIIGLSATRYSFYAALLAWYLLGHMKKINPDIDFGNPTFSEFWLMYKIYADIWAMNFIKYFRFLLSDDKLKPAQKYISNIMMIVALVFVVSGLSLHLSIFK